MEQSPIFNDKAAYVKRLFNSIARHYDLMNLLITGGTFAYWQRVFLRYTRFQPGERVLDLCTGTAGLALGLAPQVVPGGQVVGVDFSEAMLAVGRDKVSRSRFKDVVELLYGDAMALPFPDNSFDGVTIGFALRNVADLPQTLREMYRVLKPGGRAFSLELSHPRHPLWRGPYKFYFEKIVPWLGRLNEKDLAGSGGLRPYAYLPYSLRHFPDQDRLADLFRQAGFVAVGYQELTGGIVSIHYGTKPAKGAQV